MKTSSKFTLLALVAVLALGCGNADMKNLNPGPGQVTLYTAGGEVLKTYDTDGMPQMNSGGHLYFVNKATGKEVILYGTYVFEEK